MKNVDWVESTAAEGGYSGKFYFYCGTKLCMNLKNYFCYNRDGLQQETLSVLRT